LPEVEISPVRHFIVTHNAGGFILGAFHDGKLVGFCLSVPAVHHGEKAFYSHMTAVQKDFQGYGIGAKLKWRQREKSLEMGVKYIKWTFQPVMARNAFFNIEKLGAIVGEYMPKFYGTDYSVTFDRNESLGVYNDRLFAEWHLEGEKVKTLSAGKKYLDSREVVAKVRVTPNWNQLKLESRSRAIDEQARIEIEFRAALKRGLICGGFERSGGDSKYLFYAD